MSKAVAMSMGESQALPDQTAKINEKATFGPATRGHYDDNEWAVILPSTQTQEILLNPEPKHRKRPPDGPAFLKPSSSAQRLPALLKILHSIPLAREALLHRDMLLPDYRREKSWWDGTPIKHLRIVDLDLDGRPVNDDSIIYETQRLIAFLDGTTRAYGSAEVVADAEGIKLQNEKISGFVNEWREAVARATPDASLIGIFDSRGTKTSRAQPEMRQSERFHSLIVRVDDEIASRGLTLYDAIDHVLWADNREEEDTYLEAVGDVLPMEINNQVTDAVGVGVDIPATLYIDRYLPSSTKLVKDMLREKSRILSDIERREKGLSSHTRFCSSDGSMVDGRNLIDQAQEYFAQTSKYKTLVNNAPLNNIRLLTPYEQVAQELEIISERIADKLRGKPE